MKKFNSKLDLALLLLPVILFLQPISAIDFVFNGFNSSSVSLYGSAIIESRILILTNQTSFEIGRALYPTKIPTKDPNSSFVYPFSTSFIFAMAPYKNVLPGHGLLFLFVPFTGIQGSSSAQNLGFLNFTNGNSSDNHMLGIEFDVFANEEFSDMNDNHVGIDVNSLTSIEAADAGYWPDNSRSSSNGNTSDEDSNSFKEQDLNNGKNYQVWIDYEDSMINVTMAPAGMKRPARPLLNVSLNLSDVFEDEMYVGFTSSTGQLVQSHKILAWSFSNSNFSLSERLITTGLPSFVLPKDPFYRSKVFIAGATVGGVLLVVSAATIIWFLIKRRQRKAREREEMEDWELEYWPHRIRYQEIEAATKGFSEENVIGIGGNGKVYKGVLPGGTEIAVKRISHENDGMREFLAEISSLGRLKHRSLVGLRGWCKRERGVFMLVYDYMENGSLEKRVFDCDESKMLSCEERIRILKDVASALLYLHEGWDSQVLHRDIKASNVLLDRDMNGRLGDFGLARVHGHGQVPSTTRVVGTIGYMAPEVVRSGRASARTDVFGFGVLILEVMCGRRPIEEGQPPLVESVWQLMLQGQSLNALDERLKARGEQFDEGEVERMLHLGLLCAYPDSKVRPTMRQVVKVMEGNNELSEIESEDMDACLLQQMKSKDFWSSFSQSSSHGSHPTFDEIRRYNSSSMSLSWSNTVVEGNGFRTVLDIDAVGTFTMCHEALPYLKKGGLGQSLSGGGIILNISATLHYTAAWYQINVAAAKAAVDAIGRNLALEWGTDYNIRVNGIAPGPISGTPGMSKLVPEEINSKAKDFMPLYKLGEKWDIAMAALYLASDAGKYVNGTTLVVDGGLWLSRPRHLPKDEVKQVSRAVEKKSRNARAGVPSSKL